MFLTGIVEMQHAVAEWAKFGITGVVDKQWNGVAPPADFMALCIIPRFAIF